MGYYNNEDLHSSVLDPTQQQLFHRNQDSEKVSDQLSKTSKNLANDGDSIHTAQNSTLKVVSFKEKPNKATAQEYLDEGNYYWNAGMFIWSVKTILKAYEQHASGILETLCINESKFGTEEEQEYIDEVYPKTEKISVDYAILERAENTYTIPSDIGWSDLGTWNSLHTYLDKDENGNVVQTRKSNVTGTTNSLIRGQEERIMVIKGLDNYIVVDEPGALLIYPKEDEQEIKEVVKSLNSIVIE